MKLEHLCKHDVWQLRVTTSVVRGQKQKPTIEKLFFFPFLSENEIASWGAPRKNRLRLPASITTPRLPKGEHTLRMKDGTLAVRLNDKKEIYFSSTMHKANVADSSKKNRHGNNVEKNYKLSMTKKVCSWC